MVTDILDRDRAVTDLTITVPRTPSADTIAVAKRVWTQALESCAACLGLESAEAAADQIWEGNGIARMQCCRALAEGIAASLTTSHQNIQAVYAPDCGACPEGFCVAEGDSEAPFVHLLIWAQRKTPALGARVAALGNALARVCQDMRGTQELPTLLQAQVIGDAELEGLFGAGQRDRWSVRLQAYLLASNDPVEEVYVR